MYAQLDFREAASSQLSPQLVEPHSLFGGHLLVVSAVGLTVQTTGQSVIQRAPAGSLRSSHSSWFFTTWMVGGFGFCKVPADCSHTPYSLTSQIGCGVHDLENWLPRKRKHSRMCSLWSPAPSSSKLMSNGQVSFFSHTTQIAPGLAGISLGSYSLVWDECRLIHHCR